MKNEKDTHRKLLAWQILEVFFFSLLVFLVYVLLSVFL